MIWRRVFEFLEKEEKPKDGLMGGEKCPGETDCFDFQSALGTDATDEQKREDACTFCPMLSTKPLVQIEKRVGQGDDLTGSQQVEWLVNEVELLIADEDANFPIDWTFHDPELYPLIVEWRLAEKHLQKVLMARR